MRSRLLLNLALAITAIALAAYLFLVPPAADVAPPRPDLDATISTALRISVGATGDDREIQLVHAGSTWQMMAPYAAPADTTAIDRILMRLPPAVHRRYGIDELELTEVGLAPAQASLHLSNPAGDASFEFGSRAPLEGYRYLLADGAVFLASDAVFYLVSGGPLSLLDRHPVSGNAAIERLELPTISLARTDTGWERMPDDGAASDADQTLIDRWISAQAINVVALEGSPPDDLLQIVVVRVDGSSRRFHTTDGAAAFTLYDLDAGLMYEMPADARAAMLGSDRSAEVEGE